MPPILDKYGGAAGSEIVTMRRHGFHGSRTPCMAYPTHRHPSTRIPCGTSMSGLSSACEKKSAQPACPSDARPSEPSASGNRRVLLGLVATVDRLVQHASDAAECGRGARLHGWPPHMIEDAATIPSSNNPKPPWRSSASRSATPDRHDWREAFTFRAIDVRHFRIRTIVT